MEIGKDYENMSIDELEKVQAESARALHIRSGERRREAYEAVKALIEKDFKDVGIDGVVTEHRWRCSRRQIAEPTQSSTSRLRSG